MNPTGGYETDTVVRIETNLDDLSPEISGAVMEKLFEAGALDVWFTPVHMKKNRPGVMLSVLGQQESYGALIDLVLTETSAFGVRVETIARVKLERRFESVSTEFGEITIKLGLKGGTVVQAAPEFESCRQASVRTGKPLRAVYEAAQEGWRRSAAVTTQE
jgi:uncharacterized protein (DUF111 family)